MKLDYSFGTVPTHWIDGPPPINTNGVERVRIEVKGASDGPFPAVFPVGDLLPYKRPVPKEQHAVTLLLQYIVGYNPPLTTTPPTGKFYPAPGAPIIGQIRVALTKEAIAAIQKSDDPETPYKIAISGIEFHHVTAELAG